MNLWVLAEKKLSNCMYVISASFKISIYICIDEKSQIKINSYFSLSVHKSMLKCGQTETSLSDTHVNVHVCSLTLKNCPLCV